MAANNDGFEELVMDDDFFAQLDQVEMLARASLPQSSKSQSPPPLPLLPPTATPTTTTAAADTTTVRCFLPQRPPPPPVHAVYNVGPSFASKNNDINFSPPRSLSQRPSNSNGGFAQSINGQELEIERLKKELERVSKQLNGLEQECEELRRERDKKDKQLKSVFPKAEAKSAEDSCSKREVGDRESEVLVRGHPGVSPKCQNANNITEVASRLKNKGRQAIGVQTDYEGDFPFFDVKKELCTDSFLQKKLQSIWSSSNGHKSRSFITKLLETCTTDFVELLGYLGLNMSIRLTGSLEKEISTCIAPGSYVNSLHSAQSTRISNLCYVLVKIRDGMLQANALLNVLLDLCNTENALVIHKSLCILHVALDLLLTMGRRHGRRENVKVEALHADQNAIDFLAPERQGFWSIYGISRNVTSKLSGKRINDSKFFDSKGQWDYSDKLFYQVSLGHIFEKMCVIAMKSTDKQVQSEAVSIMNAILVRSNSYSDREEYGQLLVFEAVAQLLRKESGLSLQREAVRLLHLLLNCPKLLAKFCFGWKDLEVDGAKPADCQVSHAILQGIADCIAQCGNDAPDIMLCRNAMVVLAFLASSGTSGFEIVLFHMLSNGANFLGLILRVLASEIDAEASESVPTLDILKERTLFMREALILLNRLASNPSSSATVLQVLTSSRGMITLSIDIVTRLSRECRQLRTSDRAMKEMRQSEVTNLARVFKKRVFSFLGESISS